MLKSYQMKQKKFGTSRITKRTIGLGVIALVAVGLFVVNHYGNKKNNSITPATISASPLPSAIDSASAGNDLSRGPGQASPGSPQPTTATSMSSPTALSKPIGQLLNKSSVSLSASESDGQHNGSMVSTILSAAPGSTNTIMATASNGSRIAIGKALVADANGQGGEVPWNVKDAGLTVGIWQIQIMSQRNTASAQSDSEQLNVRN